MYDSDFLDRFEDWVRSGKLEEDFKFGSQSKKHDILGFLERFMDLAELADEAATKLLFKDSYLSMFSGMKNQE